MRKDVINDLVFCANFCYFDRPMFDYTEQQVGALFSNRYSHFEIKKLEELYEQYKKLDKPVFKCTMKGRTVDIYTARDIMIVNHIVGGFVSIKVYQNKLPKTFKTLEEAIEYVNIYYPKLLIRKKYGIF